MLRKDLLCVDPAAVSPLWLLSVYTQKEFIEEKEALKDFESLAEFKPIIQAPWEPKAEVQVQGQPEKLPQKLIRLGI